MSGYIYGTYIYIYEYIHTQSNMKERSLRFMIMCVIQLIIFIFNESCVFRTLDNAC